MVVKDLPDHPAYPTIVGDAGNQLAVLPKTLVAKQYDKEKWAIPFLDSASKCVELISSEKVSAEPGLWLPWLLVEYPITRKAT